MDIIQQTKTALRISHNGLDGLLETDIEAGAGELFRAGVKVYETDDSGNFILDNLGNRIIRDVPLIKKAIELYAKGMEDYEEKGDRYMKQFEMLRDSMAVSEEYRCEMKSSN